jgi:hypothetical protein
MFERGKIWLNRAHAILVRNLDNRRVIIAVG